MRDKLAGLKESNAPLYLQLARNLREHIESGGVEPGEPLPSERELSERMGMSRVTIRKGIQKLIEEGLLFRRHGSGTYVRSEEHTSELQSLMRISYAVFCLQKKTGRRDRGRTKNDTM